MCFQFFNHTRKSRQSEATVNILLPTPAGQFFSFTDSSFQSLSRILKNRVHNSILQSRLGSELAGTKNNIPQSPGQKLASNDRHETPGKVHPVV
eukprot:Gb_17263 [translate_table: standard]